MFIKYQLFSLQNPSLLSHLFKPVVLFSHFELYLSLIYIIIHFCRLEVPLFLHSYSRRLWPKSKATSVRVSYILYLRFFPMLPDYNIQLSHLIVALVCVILFGISLSSLFPSLKVSFGFAPRPYPLS